MLEILDVRLNYITDQDKIGYYGVHSSRNVKFRGVPKQPLVKLLVEFSVVVGRQGHA